MSGSTEINLLNAIQNDDKKAFDTLNASARCARLRLGRFPVLSLMYLFNARSLLSAYESEFLKVGEWEELDEIASISAEFSKRAGKCLRLYFNEVVSPLEMLLVLDKISRLKRVYPLTKPSAAVKERLKTIYYIKYNLGVKFENGNIIFDRRPLTHRQKKSIVAACVCSALAVVIAVAAPITAVRLAPKPIEGEVRTLDDIDFNSKKKYTLTRDITVPENFSVSKTNCKIDGGGKKIILGKGASFGELNGTISNVTIESGGGVFTTVDEFASVESVTLNVNASVTSEAGCAFFAEVNYGLIENVTLNVTGTLNAAAAADGAGTASTVFGGLVQNNASKSNAVVQKNYFGTVKNCTVNYSGFSLVGEVRANAVFGGVAGLNNGYLLGCNVSGGIVSDAFDIGGLCAYNGGEVSGCSNYASLSQTSTSSEWNAVVGGIAVENDYYVAGCKNEGEIKAVGGAAAYAGGIVANNYRLVENCLSSGGIIAGGNEVHAGGIMASSLVARDYTSYYFGEAVNCISESAITVSAEGVALVGGIAGFVQQGIIDYGEGKKVYVGGGVNGCYFVGAINFSGNYAGGIVGVCGDGIYTNNEYTASGGEYRHFDGNYYLAEAYSAFGATVSAENEFAAAEDKGATVADADVKNSEGYKSILSRLGKYE